LAFLPRLRPGALSLDFLGRRAYFSVELSQGSLVTKTRRAIQHDASAGPGLDFAHGARVL